MVLFLTLDAEPQEWEVDVYFKVIPCFGIDKPRFFSRVDVDLFFLIVNASN